MNPGPIDGRYGPHTQNAVRRYQTKHGLQANGIAATLTLQHLHTPTTTPIHTHTRQPTGRRVQTDRADPPMHAAGRVSQPATTPRPPTTSAVAHGGGSTAPSALFLVALALLLGLVTTWFAYRERRRRSEATDPRPEAAGYPQLGRRARDRPPSPRQPDDQTNHAEPEVPKHDQTIHRPTQPGLRADRPAGAARAPTIPRSWFRHALDLQEQGHATAAAAAYHRADELGHGGAAANLGVLHEQRRRPRHRPALLPKSRPARRPQRGVQPRRRARGTGPTNRRGRRLSASRPTRPPQSRRQPRRPPRNPRRPHSRRAVLPQSRPTRRPQRDLQPRRRTPRNRRPNRRPTRLPTRKPTRRPPSLRNGQGSGQQLEDSSIPRPHRNERADHHP